MTDNNDDRETVVKVFKLVTTAAAKIEQRGVDPELIAQGVWSAALAAGQATCGLGGLIEWLRNTADALEDKAAARLAENARRPH